MPKIKEKVLKVTEKWRKTTKKTVQKMPLVGVSMSTCSEFKPHTSH
jgi:hypothetical protein